MSVALEDWIAREAIPFSLDAPESLNAATDKLIDSLPGSVELLGFGEALHGGEEILVLRNRLFQRLVEAHGYSAIAIESSFVHGRVVNEFIAGHGAGSYETVQETGFSHGFGRLVANRELVEWMRSYNADPARKVAVQFYGFDIPAVEGGIGGPTEVLHFVLDYLGSVDGGSGKKRYQRIERLLGQNAAWENPAALSDPTKAIGLTPAATSLRLEIEDLITELRTRAPELISRTNAWQYHEVMHHAAVARQLLNFHVAVARKAGYSGLLGVRNASMAENLAYIVARERGRGKVLVFAHNGHLQRGKAQMYSGADLHAWWPAGAHLNQMFGSAYAVIASGVGVSDDNGIGDPEPGTLEACLIAAAGPARFLSTRRAEEFCGEQIAALPVRSGSTKNRTYIPLSPQNFTDFDWLAILDSTGYYRGG